MYAIHMLMTRKHIRATEKVLVQLRMSADMYETVKERAALAGQPVAALIVGAIREAFTRPVVNAWEVARTKHLAAAELECETGQVNPHYALEALRITGDEITAQVYGLRTAGGPLGPESVKQYPGLAKPDGNLFYVAGWGYAEVVRSIPVEPGLGREEKRLLFIFRSYERKEARRGQA